MPTHSMTRRLGLAFAAVSLALAAPPAGAAAADPSFHPRFDSRSRQQLTMSARGGRFVWAVENLDSAFLDRVMTGFAPAREQLLRGRFSPFAVSEPARIDLGTDRSGHAVLVYSRCADAPKVTCALYEYRFGGRREVRVLRAVRGCGDIDPQISRGVIVFMRRCSKVHGNRETVSSVMFVKRPGRRPVRLHLRVPLSFDLSGRTLAFVSFVGSGPFATVPDEGGVTEVRVQRLGARGSRVLARARSIPSQVGSSLVPGSGAALGEVQLDGRFAYWTQRTYGQDAWADIMRRPADVSAPETVLNAAGRLYARPGRNDLLSSLAVSGRRIYYGGTGDRGPYIARVEGKPAFVPVPVPASG